MMLTQPDPGPATAVPVGSGLTGRVVVVTGASRGLGRSLAQNLAASGALLGLLARDGRALDRLAASLPTEATAVSCDVADADAVAAAMDRVAARLGGLDSLVVNAGISPSARRAHNTPLEVWRQVLDVNLTGAFLAARAAYPYLSGSGRGRVVLTSSVMARLPRAGLCAYAASKAGIEGLARALAADWAADRICVNAVAPGFFEAGLGTAFAASDRLREQVLARTPLGRFGAPDELAATVSFLASDASGYLTGQLLAVDGGYGIR
jgi:NAD(P)-dependent dehydrogenase (short-subunit alcohol dehydrogenase family)